MGDKYCGISNLRFKIVYTTPEKLVASPPLNETLDQLYQNGQIDRFVMGSVGVIDHFLRLFVYKYQALRR